MSSRALEFSLLGRLQLQVDESAAHLEDSGSDIALGIQKIHRSLQLDQCAKFAAVVLNYYFIILDFDEGVGAAHADVGDLHVGLHTATYLERIVTQIEYMDNLCGSALDRLQNHVVLLRLLELHNSEHATAHLVLKRCLAKLALQRFPKVRGDLVALVDETLAIEPLFETGDVDSTHRAAALTRADELIARLRLREADTANHLSGRVISRFAVLI